MNIEDKKKELIQKQIEQAKLRKEEELRAMEEKSNSITDGARKLQDKSVTKREIIAEQQNKEVDRTNVSVKPPNTLNERKKIERIVDQQDKPVRNTQKIPVQQSTVTKPQNIDDKKAQIIAKQQEEFVEQPKKMGAQTTSVPIANTNIDHKKLERIIKQQAEEKRILAKEQQKPTNEELIFQKKQAEFKKLNANAGLKYPLNQSQKPPKEINLENGETVIFDDDIKEKIQKYDASKNTQQIPLSKKAKKSIFKMRTKKPNFILGIILNTIYLSFIAVIVVIAVGVGSVMGVANAYLETTPELDTQKIEDQTETSFILDPEGRLLHPYAGSENRELASIDEIPQHLQNAIIAVEDVRFRKHQGVDFRRLVGAFFSNVSEGTSQGGSTITQQLVKNKLLTNERSYKRKLQEAALAMELEKRYTKDEILEAYLNTIPLGGKVYGVKTAAKDYFGKELSELTLKETVCIAAITQNPTKYNPRTVTYQEDKQANFEGLINRMNMVTERMLWNDMITEEEYNATFIPKDLYTSPNYIDTWKQEMNILPESPANALYEAPHFVEYVIYQVQTALLRKEGLEDTKENRQIVDKKMRSEGYKIYSTYDKEIQDIVQSTLSEYDNYPAFKNKKFNTKTTKDNKGNIIEIRQPQAAAVVVENDTGYLRAIVGSRDEPTSMRTLNRAYQGQMPVGSSIKPLAVYGPAFDLGYGPGSGVANLKVPITGWESETGYPETSTGELGCIPLRKAIVNSLNIAAGRTLMDYVGLENSMAYLEKLGVDTQRIMDLGTYTPVGLSMGGAPITPIEVAGGYATIARGGEYLEPVSFTKVVDSNGNVIIDNTAGDRVRNQAFKKSTAWMLTDVLVEAAKDGTGKRARLDGITTAGKTGTVVDNKGVFFAGYTPYYSASLWIGHDEYKEFVGGTAASNASAPLWKNFMTKVHEAKGKTEDRPIIPDTPEELNIIKLKVCGISNLLPSGSCSPAYEDYFYAPDAPTEICDECGGGESYEYCAVSNMGFVHGVCPPDQFAVRSSRRYKEGSPYNQGGGGGGSGPPAPCNYPHNPWEGWDVSVTPPEPEATTPEAPAVG